MDYIGYLVFVYIAVIIEIKYDEQIRARLKAYDQIASELMHSPWQMAGRAVLILAIIWAQDGGKGTNEIFIATGIMYTSNFWFVFDSLFAKGVLNKPFWYLGQTSKTDRVTGKLPHLLVWLFKLALAGSSIWYVIKFL